MKNSHLITRRQFLQGSSISLLALFATGCNPLAQPESSPTVVAETATTALASEVTEVTFVIGAPPEESYYQLANLTLTEAFRRNNIKFQLKYYPAKRAAEMVETGQADGEAARVYDFAQAGNYPNHLRVEEPYIEVTVMGLAVKAGIKVEGMDSLKNTGYNVSYRRGNKVLETGLPKVVAQEQIIAVDTHEQGLRMLVVGRTELYFASNEIYAISQTDEFKTAGIKNVGVLYSTVLYPYLHKRYIALAPKLAETLHQMKIEGLIKQYEEQVHWVEQS
jgi:hypothetical protein